MELVQHGITSPNIKFTIQFNNVLVDDAVLITKTHNTQVWLLNHLLKTN